MPPRNRSRPQSDAEAGIVIAVGDVAMGQVVYEALSASDALYGRLAMVISKRPPLAPWDVLERRRLVQRTFLTLWEDRVRLPSGAEIDDFCVIEAPDWAAVLCVTPERRVVLVRQYRHGVRGPSLELPAGALELGEAPLAGAQRELSEETGYESLHWQPLLRASLDPSRQTATAHFFCALQAEARTAPKLDDSEDLETLLVSRGELFELIESGQLLHGVHIAAILMAERRGLL